MALLFADSFDLYADLNDAVAGGWSIPGAATVSFSTSNGRFGGGCLQGSVQSGTGVTTGITNGWTTYHRVPVGGTIIIGFAYFWTGTARNPDGILRVAAAHNASAGTQSMCFQLKQNNSGDLTAHRLAADTAVGSTASGVLTINTWHWIEVKVNLQTGATGTMEVKLNGTTVIGPVSTIQTAPSDAAYIHFMGSDGDYRIDDVIIMDGTGSTMNDFLGDARIDAHIPNAAGGVNNWTPNTGTQLQCVDDAPNAADGDTTYIASSTAAQETRFGFTNLAVEPNNIWSVQLRARTRKPDAGLRTFRGLCNSGGTESTGPTRGFATNYGWRTLLVLDLDPDTSAAWDAAGYNSAQFGVEIVT